MSKERLPKRIFKWRKKEREECNREMKECNLYDVQAQKHENGDTAIELFYKKCNIDLIVSIEM